MIERINSPIHSLITESEQVIYEFFYGTLLKIHNFAFLKSVHFGGGNSDSNLIFDMVIFIHETLNFLNVKNV